MLEFDAVERRVFLAAAAPPAGVYVMSCTTSAAAYEALAITGAVEELPSPVVGFRMFRARGADTGSPAAIPQFSVH